MGAFNCSSSQFNTGRTSPHHLVVGVKGVGGTGGEGERIVAEGDGHFGGALLIVICLATVLVC